jgi:hypothetical protein
MGKLLNFPNRFAERQPTEPKAELPKDETTLEEEEKKTGEVSLLDNRPDIQMMVRAIGNDSERFDKIMTLVNNIPDLSLNTYLMQVRQYTPEELTAFYLNSSEIDWTAKPAFYKAIVKEMRRRVDNALDR